MSFEKEFPSLKEYYDEWCNFEDVCFSPDEVKEHCLDKAKVKEAIKKSIEHIHTWDEKHKIHTTYRMINIKKLNNELGL